MVNYDKIKPLAADGLKMAIYGDAWMDGEAGRRGVQCCFSIYIA
jgi:hypothetical protein